MHTYHFKLHDPEDLKLQRLHDEIAANLHIIANGRDYSYESQTLERASDKRHALLLEAFLKVSNAIVSDTKRSVTVSLNAIQEAYGCLLNNNVTDIIDHLSPLSVRSYVRVWTAAVSNMDESIDCDLPGLLLFAVLTKDEERDIMESIVCDRLPKTAQEAQEMLTEALLTTKSLSSGSL